MAPIVHEMADDERHLADWSKCPDIEARVPALLDYCREHFADDELLIFDDQRITYGELEAQSAVFARRLLASGVGKATRVGIILPNSPQFLITWFAITRIGAVAVPISTVSTPAEIHRTARHADLALLVSATDFADHNYVERLEASFPNLTESRAPYRFVDVPFLRDIWLWADQIPTWAHRIDLSDSPDVDADLLAGTESEVRPADPVSIIYTSGSTSDPKGVIHTQGSMLRQGTKIAATYPFSRGDRVFTPMPLFWVGGFTLNLLNVMNIGATMVCATDTSPSHLLDLIERERITYFVAWPHTARALTAHPSFATRDLSSLRGGLLYEVAAGIRRPGASTWGEALGMTETGGPHTISVFEIDPELPNTFGTPMPGMQLRIVDPHTGADLPDGETGVLFVRGDSLMQGLVKREREEVFEPDGWYRTGDLGSFRGNHLYFHGRADDLIKTAGANVSPGEVQAVLRAMPGVGDAHVTGLPDPERGAVVGAVVVPQPGHALDPDQIRGAAREQLSGYKVPRVILVMEAADLPMMSSGKVDRRTIVAKLHEAYSHARS
ncbi:MAG: class I adenylate-forming enzyme family protein [Acidimicrobiia bacterium]